MDGVQSDKVNINVGGGEGGGGMGGMAAVIAALGNRNQGGDTAALIAALGNRNDSAANLGPLLAMMGNRHDHDGGMNSMWPLLLLLLAGRGRGGLLGGEDCAPTGGVNPGHAAILQTLMEGQSSLRAEVPVVALETQNALQNAIAQLALGTQQGLTNVKDSVQLAGAACLAATAGVKDSVQNTFAVLNQNILDQGCKGREATAASTTAILSRIDRNEIDTLRHERDRAERAIEVNALRSQVEVNQTVNTTTNQAQAQAQSQLQFQGLRDDVAALRGLVAIANQTMIARQGQDIVNLGTMLASGTQAAANTQVR